MRVRDAAELLAKVQAEHPALKAREAAARSRDLDASKARDAQVAKERQIKAEAITAQARAAAAAKGDPVPLDLSKHLRMKAENFEKSKGHPWPVVPRGEQTFEASRRFLNGFRDADRRQLRSKGAVAQAGHVEQVLHEPIEPFGLLQRSGREGSTVIRRQPRIQVRQRAERANDAPHVARPAP